MLRCLSSTELLTGLMTGCFTTDKVAHVDKVQDKEASRCGWGRVQSDPVTVTNRHGPRDVLHVLSVVQGTPRENHLEVEVNIQGV
jgi:hypothetical protein